MIDPVILAGMLESGRTYKTHEVRDMINECPRIDAKAVEHARWTDDMYFDEPVTRCTACKRGFAKGHRAERFPYCPNCGAKMDATKEAT